MINQKQVGNWTLLETETDRHVLNYANTYDKNEKEFKYHKGILENSLKYCKNKRIALDIGASYGFVSNELSFAFESVKSFEIVPIIRNCLKQNLAEKTNVEIFETGLSDFKGKIQLKFFPERTVHSTSNTNIKMKYQSKEERIICNVVTLDELNLENKIDFIKMDVEDHELRVLKGAKNTITKNLPVIMLELHSYDIMNVIKITEFLTEMNYVCVESDRGDYTFVQKNL
jgi:FkbM family methyltransferase